MINEFASATPGIGHNSRPFDLIRERAEKLARMANNWARQAPEILDEEKASRLEGFLKQIAAAEKALKSEKDREKRPHLDANTEIELRYKPVALALTVAESLLKPKREKWLQRQQAALNAIKELERLEAARLAREAEEATAKAHAGAGDVVGNIVRSTELAAQADAARREAEKPVARARVSDPYGGRASSLRVLWRAEVDDPLLAMIHYQDHPDMRALLKRLADAEAPKAQREGREIPGCRLVAKEIAA